MHYPQFREQLFHIATEKRKQAEQIAEKFIALGGKIPRVPELGSTHENSWQQLLTALDEENRSADHLIEQIRALESGYPDISKLLQQISGAQNKHRDETREMLMRSDPFAFSLASWLLLLARLKLQQRTESRRFSQAARWRGQSAQAAIK